MKQLLKTQCTIFVKYTFMKLVSNTDLVLTFINIKTQHIQVIF